MRRLIALGLATLVVAGCTNLPTSGPVQLGVSLDVTDDTYVQYIPAGPAEDATPQEILDGFIAAGAAAQDDYRVARSFLTNDFAAEWNPLQESVVRGRTSSTSVTDNTIGYLTTEVDARVTRGGLFSVEDTDAAQSFEFELEQVNGQWRIARAPDAVFVSESMFESTFQEFTIYFYNADRTGFVPDVRYFPRSGDPATEIARALVAGPSEFLPDATSAFPASTTITTDHIDVADGRASVDISAGVLTASTVDQQDMVTQLTASLAGISDVTAVSMVVDGRALAVSTRWPMMSFVEQTVMDSPLVLSGDEFGFVAGASLTPVGSIGAAISSLNPTSVSYNDSDSAAVGTANGVYRVGNPSTTVSHTTSVVEPQIDSFGSVWWVSPSRPFEILIDLDGVSRSAKGPWVESDRILGLEVSRDDSRLAVAVQTDDGIRMYVAAIERGDAGEIVTVGSFRRLHLDGVRFVDLAWVDSTHIAAITRTANGALLELASIGGVTTLIGQPTNPASVVGGNGRANIIVRSVDGQLWKPRAGGWQPLGWTVDLLATQH